MMIYEIRYLFTRIPSTLPQLIAWEKVTKNFFTFISITHDTLPFELKGSKSSEGQDYSMSRPYQDFNVKVMYQDQIKRSI